MIDAQLYLLVSGKLVIIDGIWSDTLLWYKELWRLMGQLLIPVVEMRNPWIDNIRYY